MNFGFRLPGPFRVSVSDKGKVYGGVTVGPFSVAGQLGGRSQAQGPHVYPLTLDEAVAVAESHGWKITGRWDHVVTMRRRMSDGQIRAVPGGVVLYRTASQGQVLLWLGLGVLMVVGCGLWGYLG